MEIYKHDQLFLLLVIKSAGETAMKVLCHPKSIAYRNKISLKLGYRRVNARKYVRYTHSFYYITFLILFLSTMLLLCKGNDIDHQATALASGSAGSGVRFPAELGGMEMEMYTF